MSTTAPDIASPEASKVTPQLVCGTLAGILISESERFLDGVVSFLRLRADSAANQDLVAFLTQADSFCSTCCLRIAAELKESSALADIRETSEPVLARLVRNRCFDTLDSTLGSYVDALRSLNVEVKSVVNQLSDSKVKDLLAGGASSASAASEGVRRLAQLNKGTALLCIWDYLRLLTTLPAEVMDYGSAKTFGPDADYQMQKGYIQNVLDSLQPKMAVALNTIEGFEAVREKKWAQSRAEEDAAIKGVAFAATRQISRRKSSTSSLLIGIVCLAPLIAVATLGLDSPQMLVGGIVVALVGVIFLFRALANFLDA